MEGNPNARYCPCDFCETLVVCESVIGLWLCFWCRPESKRSSALPGLPPELPPITGSVESVEPPKGSTLPLDLLLPSAGQRPHASSRP